MPSPTPFQVVPNGTTLTVRNVTLSPDGETVMLELMRGADLIELSLHTGQLPLLIIAFAQMLAKSLEFKVGTAAEPLALSEGQWRCLPHADPASFIMAFRTQAGAETRHQLDIGSIPSMIAGLGGLIRIRPEPNSTN